MKIKIEKLTIKYDEEAILRDLDLAVRNKEFVTILGRSGCGKTTILNILSGTVKADEGTVHINDEPVNGIVKNVAYMPQDDLLLPWETVLDNVTLYGRINGGKNATISAALENMEAFGLKGYEYKYPSELSGGMRQRAAFLRTALCGADILLLDEPFASLDVVTRKEMQNWLMLMKNRLDSTVLMVTHDIDEALLLSDRIIVLSGSPAAIEKEFIIEDGSVNDVIKDEIWEMLLS